MSKVINKICNNKLFKIITDRKLYTIIYITTCILWFFPLLGSYVDPISKICFIWGTGLIVWDFFTKRRMFKSSYWLMPILIMASYGVTILFNIRLQLYMGIKHMVYLGISLLILYAQDRKQSPDEIKKLLYRINNIIIGIGFVASLVSLGMFVFNFSYTFMNGDRLLRQGFLENRLFGVYTSPNTGALFVIISFASMLINNKLKRNSVYKSNWFYIVNFIVQFVYFSLTLSNGGFLTLVAFLALFAVIIVMPALCRRFGNIKSVIAVLLIVVVSVAGLKVLMTTVRTGMAYVPSIVHNLTNDDTSDDDDQPNEQEGEEKVVFERIESGDDMSNNRFTIWLGSLKVLAQKPIFGTADMMFKEGDTLGFDISKLTESEQTWVYKHNGNLHNAYVHILTYSGIMGFALFLIFAVLIVKKVGAALWQGNKKSQWYDLIGMMFVILGAIAANGMVEAHLLYTRQDPYGAIFWLFVGIACVMTDLYRNSDDYFSPEQNNSEEFAFACDTPLQVLNCMNFVQNDIEESKGKSDIYIYHQFKGSAELSERLKKEGVFNNVYDIGVYKNYPSAFGKLATLLRISLPQNTIKRNALCKIPMGKKAYKYVVASFPTTFTTGLHRAYPNAEVLLIEDGTGSYFGDIIGDYSSSFMKFIDNFFVGGELSLNPARAYLSNPELCKSTREMEKCTLPVIGNDTEKLAQIKKVYAFTDNNQYKENKFIYLTQPLEQVDGFVKANEDAVTELFRNNYHGDMLLRVHPRQKNSYDGFKTDSVGNLWELECIEQISDDNVLIASFSTTQIMPKILKDTEPTLIFLYKIFFENSNDGYAKNTEAFIEDFKNVYSDKSKIFTPSSVEELENILSLLNK